MIQSVPFACVVVQSTDQQEHIHNILEERFSRVLDHLAGRHHNIEWWKQELARPKAKSEYFQLFLQGLNKRMKAILAGESGPAARELVNVGWDEQPFLQGVYGKVLVAREGVDSTVAALYMGSATGIGSTGEKGFGLKGRRRGHESGSGEKQVFLSFH